jgi:hypothetical protein
VASTIALSSTMTWAQQFVRLRALNLGANNEPAITNANTVKQAILGPPFAWRWNRTVTTFAANPGQAKPQDYVTALASFGWIEHAEVQDLNATPPAWQALDARLSLGLTSDLDRPNAIAAEVDDNAGNITFRLLPSPDQAYPISLTTQNKAALFAGTASFWAPIPDEFSYLYNFGFLALTLLYADDPRWQWANQKFVAHLLGAAQGLTATQISVFLNNWMAVTGQPIYEADRLQQGIQARGT